MGDVFYPKAIDVLEISSGAKIPVHCDYCGDIYYPTSRNYKKTHDKNPIDCCVKCKGNKIKATNQAKYGVDNVMQVEEIVQRFQSTCLEKFGVNTPLENREIWEKTQDTILNKYGVTNCAYLPEIKIKRKQTMRERYGCDYPFQNDEIMKKVRQSYKDNGTCPTSKKQIEL